MWQLIVNCHSDILFKIRNFLFLFLPLEDEFPKTLKHIDPSDKLPKIVCLMCAKEVKCAVKLRKRIIHSHTYLKAELKKQSENKHSNENNISSDIEEIIIITESKHKLNEDDADSNEEKLIENNDHDSEEFQEDLIIKEEHELTIFKEDQCPSIKEDESVEDVDQKQIGYPKDTSSLLKTDDKPKNILDSFETTTLVAECPVCKKTYANNSYLRLHLRTHDGPAICPFCGKTYKSKDYAKQHILYYHKSGTSIVCDICGKGFRRKSVHNLHMKQHLNKKDVTCETCGKRFLTTTLLKRHIRQVHTKIKPHRCELCSKSFPRRDQLTTHLRTHTEETPFICDICQKRFKYNLCLKKHLKLVHKIQGKLTVFCSKCKQGFLSEHGLKSHIGKAHN